MARRVGLLVGVPVIPEKRGSVNDITGTPRCEVGPGGPLPGSGRRRLADVSRWRVGVSAAVTRRGRRGVP